MKSKTVCLVSLLIIALIASVAFYFNGVASASPRVQPPKGNLVPLSTSTALKRTTAPNPRVKTADFQTWLVSLQKHENCPVNGKVDSNGYKSYGALCFQRATFDKFEKEYGVTGSIRDQNIQYLLATVMIQRNYQAWRNWYNSVVYGIGLPPKPEVAYR